jgi:hypothetical protein
MKPIAMSLYTDIKNLPSDAMVALINKIWSAAMKNELFLTLEFKST